METVLRESNDRRAPRRAPARAAQADPRRPACPRHPFVLFPRAQAPALHDAITAAVGSGGTAPAGSPGGAGAGHDRRPGGDRRRRLARARLRAGARTRRRRVPARGRGAALGPRARHAARRALADGARVRGCGALTRRGAASCPAWRSAPVRRATSTTRRVAPATPSCAAPTRGSPRRCTRRSATPARSSTSGRAPAPTSPPIATSPPSSPAAAMRRAARPHLAPAIDATAERLPFDDDSFDAAMATVTIHQWGRPRPRPARAAPGQPAARS